MESFKQPGSPGRGDLLPPSLSPKFEIRISKGETILKFEILRPQNSIPNRGCFEHWDFLSFDIVSTFGSFDFAQGKLLRETSSFGCGFAALGASW
jgi:hypothetical protein